MISCKRYIRRSAWLVGVLFSLKFKAVCFTLIVHLAKYNLMDPKIVVLQIRY